LYNLIFDNIILGSFSENCYVQYNFQVFFYGGVLIIMLF
jgi:hypothetical protein